MASGGRHRLGLSQSISRSSVVCTAVALVILLLAWPPRLRRRVYLSAPVFVAALAIARPGFIQTISQPFHRGQQRPKHPVTYGQLSHRLVLHRTRSGVRPRYGYFSGGILDPRQSVSRIVDRTRCRWPHLHAPAVLVRRRYRAGSYASRWRRPEGLHARDVGDWGLHLLQPSLPVVSASPSSMRGAFIGFLRCSSWCSAVWVRCVG